MEKLSWKIPSPLLTMLPQTTEAFVCFAKKEVYCFFICRRASLYLQFYRSLRGWIFCSSPPHTDAFQWCNATAKPNRAIWIVRNAALLYEFKRSDIYTTAHIEFDSQLSERIVKGLQYDSRMNHPVQLGILLKRGSMSIRVITFYTFSQLLGWTSMISIWLLWISRHIACAQ